MLNAFETSGNSPTSVYLIGNAEQNVFKIGIANNVEKRLRSLATASPHNLNVVSEYVLLSRELAVQVEAQLHKRTIRYLRTQWFWCR